MRNGVKTVDRPTSAGFWWLRFEVEEKDGVGLIIRTDEDIIDGTRVGSLFPANCCWCNEEDLLPVDLAESESSNTHSANNGTSGDEESSG